MGEVSLEVVAFLCLVVDIVFMGISNKQRISKKAKEAKLDRQHDKRTKVVKQNSISGGQKE